MSRCRRQGIVRRLLRHRDDELETWNCTARCMGRQCTSIGDMLDNNCSKELLSLVVSLECSKGLNGAEVDQPLTPVRHIDYCAEGDSALWDACFFTSITAAVYPGF